MSFPWQETRARIAELAQRGVLRVALDRKSLEAIGPDGTLVARLVLPICLPIGDASPAAYATGLPSSLGRMLVFLLRAGASAAGVWLDDELLVHKVVKKYVVRGNGKAQTTYRKTKGKSRAGSRLRLRNAESLLEEIKTKLRGWQGELGGFDRVFYYAPERMRSELFAADPRPPFGPDDAHVALVPLHVHEPGFAELLRVHRALTRGWTTGPGSR